MELKQLHYFLKVCDAPSLSEAAHGAGISQPALSRHVRLLEEELGVTLFNRHPRGMVLSEAGTRLRESASLLLKEADRIKADLAAEAAQPRGELSVGTPSSLRRALVTPAIAQMRASYPAVRFHISEGTSRSVRDSLVAGRIELALLSTLEDLESLNVTRLASEALFLIGPRKANLRIDVPIAVTDIAERPMILTARPNSLRLVVDRALARHDMEVEAAIEVETLQMALDLIDTTGSFSVFPYCAIEIALRENRITASPIDKLHISWAVATAKDRPLTAAAQLFIDRVVGECRRRVDAGEWRTAVLNLGPASAAI
jgi:LysR family transcriptional regulator, nitrogen assimilation regulatory protein